MIKNDILKKGVDIYSFKFSIISMMKSTKKNKIFSKKRLPNNAFFANFVQLYW